MNAANLRACADYIEAQPEGQFDQKAYLHPCGTPSCIAGHEAARSGYNAYDDTGLVAQRSLGLTNEQAFELFASEAPWQKPDAACIELRRLADLAEMSLKL